MFAGALCFGGLLASQAFPETIVGSGVKVTKEREIPAVTEVDLSGIGELVLTQGDVPSLRVTADDNIVPFLEAQASGHRLTLHSRSGYHLQSKTPIVYNLTLPKVDKLSISGVGSLRAAGLKGDNLAIKISGAGKANVWDLAYKSTSLNLSGACHATVSGRVEKVTIKMSGAGEIDAVGLSASTGDVSVTGAGKASVWASNELKARSTGAGVIKYKGTPKLDQKTSGAGSIKPLEG